MTHVDTTTLPAPPPDGTPPRVLRVPRRHHGVAGWLSLLGVGALVLAGSATAGNWRSERLTTQLGPGELVVAMSSLNPSAATNGWGPYERNRSNGQRRGGDGNTLTIGGVRFDKGLGTHAPSSLKYDLGGQYSRFESSVGVDDTEGSNGSVTFEVWVDGVRKELPAS